MGMTTGPVAPDRHLSVGLHLGGDVVGPREQRLDDLVFRHGLDDLALDEDLSFAVARSHAEIGLAGFSRPVDDASHHGDANGRGDVLESLGDRVRQLDDIDLGATAARA